MPADIPCHPFKTGDFVLIKDWETEPLKPQWSGPYQILLTTHTAVKVAEKKNWIHHTRVKKAAKVREEENQEKEQWESEPIEGIRYLFKRKKKASEAKENPDKERPPSDPD